ncbi:MAG: hypothetical protein OXN94_07250 [Chloroflexota bacterium]|nr:hypothetical protein [Chloroflexota bacterium]
MIDAPVRTVSDVIAEFLACKPSDEAVLTYFIPPYLQDRVHFLLDLNGEDELTAIEAEELDELARADDFISLLKAKIKRRQRLSAL